jgi:nitroreductase
MSENQGTEGHIMTVNKPERLTQSEDDSRDVGRLVLGVIQSRRSIREGFIDKPIPDEVLTEIIQSGLTAPSSKNAQPWRIHVVRRGEILSEIADYVQFGKCPETYVPHNPATGKRREWASTVVESAQVLREVGVGLFVENTGAFSGSRQTIVTTEQDLLHGAMIGYSFEVIGLGAMIENMWLSAHAQGLGGVFMGDVGIAETEIQSRLAFSGDLVGVLALGYTVQEPWDKSLRADTVVYHTPETGEA